MGLFSRLNIFNRHMKIERFMFSFFLVALPLTIMTFVSVYNKFGLDSQKLSENAVYTKTSTLSRTGQSGTVEGVFVNKDKTRGMVLIKMNDASKMSSNANDYKVFTTAVNAKKKQERIKTTPTGSIYVFGSSGYIGLYFINNAGFDSQIFKSTIRLEKELVSVDNSKIAKEVEGTSYAEHDQMDVYFNLGATQAVNLNALDKDDLSVQDLYIEAVGAKSDAEQRKVLVDDLTKMSKLKLQIDEMQGRLKTISIDGVGLVVPDLPKEIKSDSYSGSGDDIMMSTDFVYKGGLNFNWHNIKPEDGYFKSINNKTINPDNLSLARWLVKLKNDLATSTDKRTYEVDWVMSDGSSLNKFVNDLGLDNSAVNDMNKQVQNYVALVSEYMGLKYQYQTKDLKNLVSLDIDLESATSNVDSVSDEHFFTY